MKTILTFMILFIASVSFTQTKEHRLDKWLSDCMEKDGSTMGMILCSDTAAVLWDKELNTVYDLLMNNLGENARNALRDSQREWIKFRDKEFEAIDAYYTYIYEIMEGGTMYPMLAAGARMEVIRKRALELTAMYDELNAHLGNSDE